MICLQCKKQIPDDSSSCSECGTPIVHQVQVVREISFRRYQRWIFYGILSFVFLAMVAIIARIYNANAKMVSDLIASQNLLDETKKKLASKEGELGGAIAKIEEANRSLEDTNSKLSDAETKLGDMEASLKKKENDFKAVLGEKTEFDEKYKKCQLDLDRSDANVYSLIIKLGKGISNKDLLKIPMADSNLIGDDGDGDGLPDKIEETFGSDPAKKDSDGDGYDDKSEVLRGYDPKSAGKLPIDNAFTVKQKGNILLQVEANGEAWYVAGDGKRYLLGFPKDAFRIMRQLDYWTNDWKSPAKTAPISAEKEAGSSTTPQVYSPVSL